MSEFWAKTKAGLAEAADVSKRAALKTKAKADLELLKRKLSKLKSEFGLEVFPFYESDRAKADAIYANYKERIDAVVASIQAKQQEIDNLQMKKKSSSSEEYGFPGQQNHQQHQASSAQSPAYSEI